MWSQLAEANLFKYKDVIRTLNKIRLTCRSHPLGRNYSNQEQSIKYDLKSATKDGAPTNKNSALNEKLASDLGSKPKFRYQWFRTAKGQKFVGFSFIFASIGSAAISMAPHTFMLGQTKDFYQHYTKGMPARVTTHMMGLFQEVVEEMKLEADIFKNIRLFVISQTEAFSWGDVSSQGMIGYPVFFHYQDSNEVPLDRMYFGLRDSSSPSNLTPAQLDSPNATQFCEQMVLSDEARKFVLAREMFNLKSQSQMMGATLPPLFIMLTLYISRTINKTFEMFKKPPIIRGIAYCSILPSMSLLYFTFKDGFRRVQQNRMDEAAAGLSPSYARGGAEYYGKFLKRNAALRGLQKNGPSLYTLHGDFVPGLIRLKNRPLSDRRDTCLRYVSRN